MRIVSMPISVGDNNFQLTPCTECIEKIEFETNAKQYGLKFIKSNNFDNRQEVKLYVEHEEINYNWFTQLSDGLTNLKISSTCSGVFTIYFGNNKKDTNPLLEEIALIKKDFECNYYFEKYFTPIAGGYLVQYDRIKDFKYYRDSITKIIASWATTCYQNVKTMSVPQALEYIYSVEITSSKDSVGSLHLSNDIIYTFDIKQGTHVYPLVIPRKLAVYTKLTLSFNDLVTIKYIFFNLPTDLTKFLYGQKVVIEQYPVYVFKGIMDMY